METRSRAVLSWTLRLLIAAVFCLSAIAKLVGIDQFEVYVFSFGFFPLTACYLLARLCIAAEFILALFVLGGWYPRTMRLATVGLLVFFSLFLCYSALVGRNESCQCFGQWVDMNPLQSLLKNAVLLLLVLLNYRLLSPRRLLCRWVPLILALGLAVVPFVVSVPDNWMFGAGRLPYNEELLKNELHADGALASHGLGSDRRLLAFVTKGCPYCKISREKLDAISARHGIAADRIVYLLPSDLPDNLFIEITYGSRPLLMLLDGDSVVATYHSRNIDEKEVARFLAD